MTYWCSRWCRPCVFSISTSSVFHACLLGPEWNLQHLITVTIMYTQSPYTTLSRQLKQPIVPLWCCMCSASQWRPGLICSIDERLWTWSESTVLNCDLERRDGRGGWEKGITDGQKMWAKRGVQKLEWNYQGVREGHCCSSDITNGFQRFPPLLSLIFPTGGSCW